MKYLLIQLYFFYPTEFGWNKEDYIKNLVSVTVPSKIQPAPLEVLEFYCDCYKSGDCQNKWTIISEEISHEEVFVGLAPLKMIETFRKLDVCACVCLDFVREHVLLFLVLIV